MDFFIRGGKSSDITSVLMLIKELAKIKKQEERLSLTIYDLINDGFSKENRFDLLVAEKNKEVVGFALYSKTYSIFGKSLILEDVFVTKEHKNEGIGISLFAKFLEIAEADGISRLEWSLLKEFKSLISLYEKAGAEIIWDCEIYEVNKNKINWFLEQNIQNEIDTPFKSTEIRFGEMRDMLGVIELFNEIASKNNTVCNLDVYDLIKDGFSNKPLFKTIVLEIEEEVVGVLLFFNSYATFEGRSLVYEELYLKEKYEAYGFEEKMTTKLFKYALKNNIMRIQRVINKFDAISKKRYLAFGGEIEKEKVLVQISYEALDNFVNK